MTSVVAAMSVMLLVSAGVAVLSWRWARRRKPWQGVAAAVVAIGFIFAHAIVVSTDVRVVRYVTSADAIVWSNLQPIASGVLLGVAWALLTTPLWQRLVLLVPLVGFSIYRTVEPATGPWPALGKPMINRSFVWRGVVRQTSKSSCSAAAAATALRYVGIPATEQEMATLCLTQKRGTFVLGLYRGLKIKTDDTPYHVTPFHGSLESLLSDDSPALVSITVAQSEAELFPAGHTVVVKPSLIPGLIEMADPYVGPMRMKTESFAKIWNGQALRIEKR